MFLAVIIPGDSYFWVVNKSIAAIWCFIQGSCSFRYMLEVNDQQTRRSNQTDGKIFNQAEWKMHDQDQVIPPEIHWLVSVAIPWNPWNELSQVTSFIK